MPQLWLNDTLDLLTAPYTAEVGTEFGDWQAITTAVDSLFLDGSVVSGEATGNRTVRLQVSVAASPRWALVEACEALFVEANKAASTLRFVPDEGDAEVYDLFRAQPERTDDQSEAWTRRQYTLTFPAQPFVRSGVQVTPAALAPRLVVEDFEGAFDGLALGTVDFDGTYQYVLPTSDYRAPLDFADLLSMEADTNCGEPVVVQLNGTNGNGGNYVESRYEFTATANGDAILRSVDTWPVTGDVVSVCGGFFKASGTGWLVGVEFLDTDGTSLGTTWGAAAGPPAGTGSSFATWVTAVVPLRAISYRLRSRLTNCIAGQKYHVTSRGYAGAQASVGDADRRVTTVAYQGTKGMYANPQANSISSTDVLGQRGQSIYGRLPGPLDLTGKAELSVQVADNIGVGQIGVSGCYMSLRLYDADGNFSRWPMTGPTAFTGDGSWEAAAAHLEMPPEATGPAGPADLTTVTAWVIDQGQTGQPIDSLTAGPVPSGISTPRGSILPLDITGAARSPVRLTVTGKGALTDWLVAAADMAAPPMLAVASNVATAEAPAPYDGVYRVIGALAPASAETNPTCTVAQLIDGVQVASQVLDGTLQAGNHYVDFGVCPLPMVGVPTDNEAVSYTFTLSPADTDWAEVLVLDMARPVAWLPNIATPMAYGWIDEPEPTAQMGRVWVGSNADRSDARSPADPPDLSLPFSVRAPGVQLLVYSTSGAPDVSLSYDPRRLS